MSKEEKEKSNRKVLLVDDEIRFCDLLKKIISKQRFYCRNCLRSMGSGQKDSSVSTRDYDSRYNASRHQWPGGLQSPLSEDKTKNIKIIAISGDLRFTKTEVIGAGANSFFTKPVNFENLLSLCNEFLEEPETLK